MPGALQGAPFCEVTMTAFGCTLCVLSVYFGFGCNIDFHLIKAPVTLLVNPITTETLTKTKNLPMACKSILPFLLRSVSKCAAKFICL